MLKSYLRYLSERTNGRQLTDPFMIDFYANVLDNAVQQEQHKIESLRTAWLINSDTVEITDLGAGSRRNKGNTRKISSIARHASIPKQYGQLLLSIIEHFKLSEVLELGTSLGIGTAYLSAASHQPNVTTIEGCPATYRLALESFKQLENGNINARCGSFDEQLESLKEKQKNYDFVYIDGNHTKMATLNYFDFALNHSSEQAFIVFDDIHWSKEMEEAWKEISNSDEVQITIDLFRMGIAIKVPRLKKKHFVLKF